MAKKQSKVGQKFTATYGQARSRGTVDWGAAPANLVHQLVIMVTNAGGAVSFGKTIDGTGASLYFLHDDIPKDKARFVLGGEEDLEDGLRYWIEFWDMD